MASTPKAANSKSSASLGLGAAVTWGGALMRMSAKLRVGRAEERVEGHGTVGLLVGCGNAGKIGDSFGRAMDGWGGLRQEASSSSNPRTRLRGGVEK